MKKALVGLILLLTPCVGFAEDFLNIQPDFGASAIFDFGAGQLLPKEGDGSPDGVVTAERSCLYWDYTGLVFWINDDGATSWTQQAAGGGDVASVGDCASGACLDGTSDGGTNIAIYDGDSNKVTISTGNLAGDITMVLPTDDGDAGEQLQTAGDGTTSWETAGGATETLAATLAAGADANDVSITSAAKIEGVDAQVYVDMSGDGIVEVESDTTISAEAPNIQLRFDAAAYLNVATADGGATTISQTSDGTDQITIGDGVDKVAIATDSWDVSNAGVMTGITLDADNSTVSNIVIGTECTGASTSLTDTADLLYETELDDEAELEAQIADMANIIQATEIDTFAETDALVADKSLVNMADGATWLGVHDFDGATSVEVPNTAGDVTCDTEGEIAVDSAQKQLAVFDGIEVAIPLRHMIQGSLGTGNYDADPDVWIVDLHSYVYPDGIVLTAWYVDANEADPDTELDANLYYCDAVAAGAFPGANPVLIDVIDTTTGNSSEADMSNSDLGSGVIPTGKSMYALIDADPTSDTTLFHLRIHFYIPES